MLHILPVKPVKTHRQFYAHRLSPIFRCAANRSATVGKEEGETHQMMTLSECTQGVGGRAQHLPQLPHLSQADQVDGIHLPGAFSFI
jgi:hypothetical protein